MLHNIHKFVDLAKSAKIDLSLEQISYIASNLKEIPTVYLFDNEQLPYKILRIISL